MDYQNVIVEQRGAVTVLTLNRPERLNAWNNDMMYEMRDVVERANADPAVAAIVFTGAGRAYCSGADIGGWAQQIQGGEAPRGSSITSVPFAELFRQHNNGNVVCLSGRFVDLEVNKEIVKTFLTTEFEGGRHEARVAKIMALD